MIKTIEAVFDGETLRPDAPLEIPPNTRVRLTIEGPVSSPVISTIAKTIETFADPTIEGPVSSPVTGSFLRTARALELSGPPDWSANLKAYLYGQKADR